MTLESGFSHLVENLKLKYDSRVVIVSPPRCSSTALARIFWGHPLIRYYSHEPFETTYYQQAALTQALEKLNKPTDLRATYVASLEKQGSGLVIKEMPYQVGENFPLLASLTDKPIIFLLRDPRLNIQSRIRKKQEAGQNTNFPLIETGWTLLYEQVQYCRRHHIDFCLVKSDEFRNHPENFVRALMFKVGLSYHPECLTWSQANHINLDNLEGAHSHLYTKVLSSTGILPADEPLPEIESFPTDGGLREHIAEALKIYHILTRANELLIIE